MFNCVSRCSVGFASSTSRDAAAANSAEFDDKTCQRGLYIIYCIYLLELILGQRPKGRTLSRRRSSCEVVLPEALFLIPYLSLSLFSTIFLHLEQRPRQRENLSLLRRFPTWLCLLLFIICRLFSFSFRRLRFVITGKSIGEPDTTGRRRFAGIDQ